MAVRQNNRRGPRATAEAGLGCLEYLVRASGQSSIHQHPFAPGSADEIHVGETDRQPAEIRRDARDRVCHGYVDLATVNTSRSMNDQRLADSQFLRIVDALFICVENLFPPLRRVIKLT